VPPANDQEYFLNKSLVAHADLGCMFLDEVALIQKPRWRVASSGDVRKLGGTWCVDCCAELE
jgi:hypothetical protein